MTQPTSSRIDTLLKKFACGPGGHTFSPTGVRMTPVAMAVPLDPSTMEAVLVCSRCEKSGWERTLACDICEEFADGVEVVATRVLVNQDGRRVLGVPLCPRCHVDLIAGASIDWRIAWVPT